MCSDTSKTESFFRWYSMRGITADRPIWREESRLELKSGWNQESQTIERQMDSFPIDGHYLSIQWWDAWFIEEIPNVDSRCCTLLMANYRKTIPRMNWVFTSLAIASMCSMPPSIFPLSRSSLPMTNATKAFNNQMRCSSLASLSSTWILYYYYCYFCCSIGQPYVVRLWKLLTWMHLYILPFHWKRRPFDNDKGLCVICHCLLAFPPYKMSLRTRVNVRQYVSPFSHPSSYAPMRLLSY